MWWVVCVAFVGFVVEIVFGFDCKLLMMTIAAVVWWNLQLAMLLLSLDKPSD